MYACMDSYTQMTVSLTIEDVKKLESSGKCVGTVWRTTGETLPLTLYIKSSPWRAYGLPVNSPYEEKKSYEIDMPTENLEKIKQRKTAGTGIPAVDLRTVYISLEGVY
jgi:hypothetical protein